MKKILLLMGLLSAAAILIYNGYQESKELQQVAAICEAAGQGQHETVLAQTEQWSRFEYDAHNAVMCRALSLLETNQTSACAELIWQAASQQFPSSWLPPERPGLAFLNWANAAAHEPLVARIQNGYLGHLPIQKAAFGFWQRQGTGAEAMDDMFKAHGNNSPDHVAIRLWLGNEWLKNNQHEKAVQALSGIPSTPEITHLKDAFFDLQLRTLGAAGEGAKLLETSQKWTASGAHPMMVQAKTALVMHAQKLKSPGYNSLEQLLDLVSHLDKIPDPKLQKNVAARLMVHYTSRSELEAAQKLYAQLPAHLEVPNPQEMAPQQTQQTELQADGTWTVTFSSDWPKQMALWVSPQHEETEPLAPYRKFSLIPGQKLTLQTTLSRRPLRWVLKDGEKVMQAGTAWPGREHIHSGPAPMAPKPAPPYKESPWAAADGHRKLVTLFLDCADWHLIQYGRQLGMLPYFDKLITGGLSGAMISEPPITAMAMEKIVWPQRQLQPSVQSFLYQMGAELGGLASVGQNPLEALQWVLPQSQNFFDVMGEQALSVANMLFSHGGMNGGRQALVTGPKGQEQKLSVPIGRRPITSAEHAALAGLNDIHKPHQLQQLEMMAAQMDMVAQFYGERHPDIMMMRIEPLDILTHAMFQGAFRNGTDNGHFSLMWVYRYLDHRLGTFMKQMQSDDLLLVYSDHGIETATKHHELAFFALYGASIKPSTLDGRPEFAGIPQLIAELMGQGASFPHTELADQVSAKSTPKGTEQ